MLLEIDGKDVEAEAEFKRAIQLNPNYTTAHHWYGNSLLAKLGRFDEAVREHQLALELDPLSFIINADLGNTFILARRYDEAIAQLRRTLALDEHFTYGRRELGTALFLKGDVEGGLAEDRKAASLDQDDPELLALLGRACAETGREAEALQLLQRLNELAQTHYVSGFAYALIYIGLGDRALALDHLEKAPEITGSGRLRIHPLLDPLRDEPRFQQLTSC